MPLNDNEVNEIKNLRKHHEHLLDQLRNDPSAKGAAPYDTESDEEDESDDDDEQLQKKMKIQTMS